MRLFMIGYTFGERWHLETLKSFVNGEHIFLNCGHTMNY